MICRLFVFFISIVCAFQVSSKVKNWPIQARAVEFDNNYEGILLPKTAVMSSIELEEEDYTVENADVFSPWHIRDEVHALVKNKSGWKTKIEIVHNLGSCLTITYFGISNDDKHLLFSCNENYMFLWPGPGHREFSSRWTDLFTGYGVEVEEFQTYHFYDEFKIEETTIVVASLFEEKENNQFKSIGGYSCKVYKGETAQMSNIDYGIDLSNDLISPFLISKRNESGEVNLYERIYQLIYLPRGKMRKGECVKGTTFAIGHTKLFRATTEIKKRIFEIDLSAP